MISIAQFAIHYDEHEGLFHFYRDQADPTAPPAFTLDTREAQQISQFITSTLRDPDEGAAIRFAKAEIQGDPEKFIAHIKAVRDRYPMGLREAKEIVEKAYADLDLITPYERRQKNGHW